MKQKGFTVSLDTATATRTRFFSIHRMAVFGVVSAWLRTTVSGLSTIPPPRGTMRTAASAAVSQTTAVAASAARRVSETIWRTAAADHQNRIYELLQPGLTQEDTATTTRTGLHSEHPRSYRRRHHHFNPLETDTSITRRWTALNPKHPVYNFLIEYYGLKGVKGVKRLARWSPPDPCGEGGGGGVLLEGATADDLSTTLHLRGAILQDDGILYNPSTFFRSKVDGAGDKEEDDAAIVRAATPYLWYRSVLQQTLRAEPVFYCHNLHEWAMQYQPVGGGGGGGGAAPPASAQYQSHVPLRVDRSVINRVVEQEGALRCTHVDALRYFAPEAARFNRHGAVLHRADQLRLEQPACLHAHMDLLKMTLRLDPFAGGSCFLLPRVLEIALAARSLDVAASPYDATAYGVDIVPVETDDGRGEYRRRQRALWRAAVPVRRDLLQAYDNFIQAAFAPDIVARAQQSPSDERFAKTEPGGLPWRKNLL